MFSIRHSNIIELIKIFSSHSDKINEISTSITASFTTTISSGSGFLYNHNGIIYVLTAAHVLLDGNNQIAQEIHTTYFKNGDTFIKKIPISNVYYNIQFDFAIMKLDDPELSIIGVQFGDNRLIKIGEPVICIGNPLSADMHSQSFGCIRDPNYIYQYDTNSYETILIDAPSYTGSSGGMLLSIGNDENIYIIGMLQFGFIHKATIDNSTQTVSVPSESFGGGLSSTMMKFVLEKIIQKNSPGKFVFPELKIKTKPINSQWLINNKPSYNKLNAHYMTNSYDSDLQYNTIIEKVDDKSVGSHIGGENLLSILLEKYYSGQQTVKFKLSNKTVYKNINDLFDTNSSVYLSDKFTYKNENFYLL